MVQDSSFLSTVVFLQPPFFFLFLFLPPFSFLFLLYTMVSVSYPLSTCESGVGSFPVSSRTSLNLLLLAVRLLVYCSGITFTLMRRQLYFQIFVTPYPYHLFGICPSPCRKVPLICYIKGFERFLVTSDKGSEMVIILGYG